jgi:hypothetical protein
MEAIGSSKTSVHIYQIIQYQVPEYIVIITVMEVSNLTREINPTLGQANLQAA